MTSFSGNTFSGAPNFYPTPTAGKVLIVEDNPDSLTLLSFHLKKREYEVLVAKSVHSAIEIGKQAEFDILVCDIGLPDGEGAEVLKALREVKRFPAIALTAHATSEEIEAQIDAGFDLHISKPYHATYLDDGIRKLLGQQN